MVVDQQGIHPKPKAVDLSDELGRDIYPSRPYHFLDGFEMFNSTRAEDLSERQNRISELRFSVSITGDTLI